jgi:hypothetical protein
MFSVPDPLGGSHEPREPEPPDEHVSVGEAYRSVDLWFGLALFKIGKGWVWLLEAALLAAIVACLPISGSAPELAAVVALVCLILAAAIGLIVQFRLEDWVNEHNDRLDDRLDAELRRRRVEGDEEAAGERWG